MHLKNIEDTKSLTGQCISCSVSGGGNGWRRGTIILSHCVCGNTRQLYGSYRIKFVSECRLVRGVTRQNKADRAIGWHMHNKSTLRIRCRFYIKTIEIHSVVANKPSAQAHCALR